MPTKRTTGRKTTTLKSSARGSAAVKKTAAKSVKSATNKTVRKRAPARRLIPKPLVFQKIHPELLRKHHGNPIIEPRTHLSWESKATFNPAAVDVGGKIHLLYRAIGDSDVSVVGHATSSDGISIDTRSLEPAFVPELTQRVKDHIAQKDKPPVQSMYMSGGGGWGGSEDPRATLIDDRIYLTYTAFDGWGSLRVALSSISADDFLNQRWLWEKPAMISPPGQIHKNWVLFPEKINGKFAILHGVTPTIMIEYLDSLDFEDGDVIKSERPPNEQVEFRKGVWDSRLRGVGPPPIKTREGWLLLYHATDSKDPGRYKLGAMLLDFNDPTKVLYRSRVPILEPEEWYENTGWKSGIVYACGAIVREGVLFVYYGGADSVVCVATANLEEFMGHLRKDGEPKLTPGPKAKPIKIL